MQYHNLFGDLQAVAALTHAVARATRRSTYTLTEATCFTTWTVTYSNEAPDVEIFAADDSKAVVILQHGEVVFSAGRQGQVLSYHRGPWENAVELLCEEAKQAGALASIHATCPWMDSIESALDSCGREPWEVGRGL
jgi:hypothetical protein